MPQSAPAPSPVPEPLARSKFDHWCWVRGLKLNEIGTALGCQPERARRLRLPFGDPLRAIPNEAEMAKIAAWTDGAITPNDFYPPAPQLEGAEVSDAEARPDAEGERAQ